MPITQAQKENRKYYIGSSDSAAIVGIDPWRSAADIFYEKTGLVESTGPDENQAMKVGRYCEDAILNWFADEKLVKVVRNQFRVHPNKITAAHFDAMVPSKPEWLVEVKSTGITSGRVGQDWGEAGTDEVPERIAIQCQHQMAILPEVEIVWIPALMVGVGFTLYRIERNNELIKDLLHIEESFWHDHVEKGIPPKDVLPSLDTLKSLRRVPNKSIPVSDDLILALQDVKTRAKFIEAEKNAAQLRVINALGDAEEGTWGGGVINYFKIERKGYVVEPNSYRQLTFKKNK